MLTRLLRLFPPEVAHRLAITALRFRPSISAKPFSPRLRTTLAGLDLPHPVGLAAGFDKNAEVFAALLGLGFAFVETGTVTPRPQAGNPSPRLFRLDADRALINRMGFNNDGIEAYVQRLAGRTGHGVVGANIGMNKDTGQPEFDYVYSLERVAPFADYVTVNVSSPNTPGLRALQKAEALSRLLGKLVDYRDRSTALRPKPLPLFVKVAPDLDEEDEAAIAEVVLASGIDGLIVANTTLARPADLVSPFKAETGGLSGQPLFVPSTVLLARFARRLDGKLALIGVGGVASAEQAYAKLRAGATAVQLYTGMIYEGPDLAQRVASGLVDLLDRDGLPDIRAAVGRDL